MPQNNEKIRKALFNEISFILSIIGVVIGCVLFVSKPDAEMRQNIALMNQRLTIMETNHLAHIQDDIEEIKQDNKDQTEAINEIEKKLTRILTLLEK